METKKCKTCEKQLPLTAFYKSSQTKDGLKIYCKTCISLQIKNERIKNGGKNRLDKSTETDEYKLCTNCKQLKLRKQFKHPSWCPLCIKIHNRIYNAKKGSKEKFFPIITSEGKQCAKCKEILNYERFPNSKRGRNGKSAYCKPCSSKIQLETYSKEIRRAKTQKYRDENREWWRFLHRINQFNRKNNVKLKSDGTVSKDFMKEIYNTSECYYCKNDTPPKQRTMEHKQPISRGGLHSKSNITMACIGCNASKQNKTEEEFYKYLKNNKK